MIYAVFLCDTNHPLFLVERSKYYRPHSAASNGNVMFHQCFRPDELCPTERCRRKCSKATNRWLSCYDFAHPRLCSENSLEDNIALHETEPWSQSMANETAEQPKWLCSGKRVQVPHQNIVARSSRTPIRLTIRLSFALRPSPLDPFQPLSC